MPYINEEHREALKQGKKAIIAGELNYQMSQLVKSYISMKGRSYTTFNEIVGVLECLKMELYRRKVSTYEDEKMSENGDVW